MIVPVDKVLAFLAFLPVLHFLHFASLVVIRVGGKSNQGPEQFVGGGGSRQKWRQSQLCRGLLACLTTSVKQSPTSQYG